MQKTLVYSLLVTALCITMNNGFTQGCSDAGICSIGMLGQQHNDSALHRKQQRITLLSTIGIGDDNVRVITPGIQYDAHLSPRWEIQAKITAGYASGRLASAGGLGDIIFSGVYHLLPFNGWKSSVTLGIKAPLNQGNLKKDGKSLPLQYQSSLGTVDVITGFSISNKQWQFAAGWQQPVTGTNGNTFLADYWDDSNAANYPPGNDFNRKGDLLLRSAYLFQPGRSLQVNLGLLGIYHLGKDTYINANISNRPIPIKDSEGLTLNITGGLWIPLNKQFTLGATGGIPVIVRDIRPDGLTRKFVFAPELSFHF